ncbi:MAG: AtpZ/AtpI family protein [Alphaproteobacteria bacterium]|nr:MAG: AtpZ/AtpI family protein [Alphaproteobacteria bacterium]
MDQAHNHLSAEDEKKLRQLEKFGQRIDAAEEKLDGKPSVIAQANRDSGLAWRVMVDIIAGPAVGLLVGYALDKATGLSPLFILLCFFLGMGGGFLNAYKTATKKSNAVGFKKEK